MDNRGSTFPLAEVRDVSTTYMASDLSVRLRFLTTGALNCQDPQIQITEMWLNLLNLS